MLFFHVLCFLHSTFLKKKVYNSSLHYFLIFKLFLTFSDKFSFFDMAHSLLAAKELDNIEQASIMQQQPWNSDEDTQQQVVYNRNRNKSKHKLVGQESNNSGKKMKTKKFKWKYKFAAVYLNRLGDINDPKWKREIGNTLSNCCYKNIQNGNWQKTGMNNLKIYCFKYIILF